MRAPHVNAETVGGQVEAGAEDDHVERVLLARLALDTVLGDGLDAVGNELDVLVVERSEITRVANLFRSARPPIGVRTMRLQPKG